MTWIDIPYPVVGCIAIHQFRELDGRPVTQVSEDGSHIRLLIGESETDWVPTSNYRFRDET